MGSSEVHDRFSLQVEGEFHVGLGVDSREQGGIASQDRGNKRNALVIVNSPPLTKIMSILSVSETYAYLIAVTLSITLDLGSSSLVPFTHLMG